MVRESAPSIEQLRPDHETAFAELLLRLKANGDEAVFHPYPLSADAARDLVRHEGRDLYYVVVDHGRVLGCGMLRGWDEGYDVPSLGIAIDPEARGHGLGLALMHFLHFVARQRGSRVVRLTVAAANRRAIALYERLGYRFTPGSGDDLLGSLTLDDE